MPKLRRLIIVIFTTLIVLSSFIYSASVEYSRAVEERKNALNKELDFIRVQLETAINKRISTAIGLVTYIQLNPDLTGDDYETYLDHMEVEMDETIVNFAAIKDTTITFVYPFEENKAAIGVDLGKIELQKDMILSVKDDKKVIITGPVDLVQGGVGLIIRMPIIINEGTMQEKYWGQMGIVLDYNRLFNEASFDELDKFILLEVHQSDDPISNSTSVIYTNVDNLPPGFMSTSMQLPQIQWEIRAIYAIGYTGQTPVFYALIFLGVITSTIAGLYVNNMFKRNEDLKKEVDRRTLQLNKNNEYLESVVLSQKQKQEELQQLNKKLEDSYTDLQKAQDQLIVKEKLATLGELVGSVAHDINTPLGIGVTLTSFVKNNETALLEKFNQDSITKTALIQSINENLESLVTIENNLSRVSDLVRSFKLMANDQYFEEYRSISIKKYLNEILVSVYPRFKNTNIEILAKNIEDINVFTYPGAISQIFTNLLINSLVHGFYKDQHGRIEICARSIEHQTLELIYRDNGVGLEKTELDKVFEPFYTTKKIKGSTGLGLHIVSNLVNKTLRGTIQLNSSKNKGVEFLIRIPIDSTFDFNE